MHWASQGAGEKKVLLTFSNHKYLVRVGKRSLGHGVLIGFKLSDPSSGTRCGGRGLGPRWRPPGVSPLLPTPPPPVNEVLVGEGAGAAGRLGEGPGGGGMRGGSLLFSASGRLETYSLQMFAVFIAAEARDPAPSLISFFPALWPGVSAQGCSWEARWGAGTRGGAPPQRPRLRVPQPPHPAFLLCNPPKIHEHTKRKTPADFLFQRVNTWAVGVWRLWEKRKPSG